ncbi:MAG TPA: hypothetical protein VEW74_03660 [Candidatus Nitrosotalea sp.]|nr:hypothetical protein [Candidatus Nitrosotalea sp.]
MNDSANEAAFLDGDRMSDLRSRWEEIQTGFVDDPRGAVGEAHAMVGRLVDELTQTFTRERTALEEEWSKNREPDTEALRLALQRYRSFFNRLLGSTETVGSAQT